VRTPLAAANGWSGNEMEAKFGIPAAQALVRVREMLAERFDVFDEIEQRRLAMTSVYKLKEQIEKASVDVDNPKAIEAYLKVIKALDDLLSKQGKISDAELEVVTKAQARALLGLIEAAYGRVREWLLDEFSGLIDGKELDTRFHEALALAATQDSDDE